MAKKYNGYVPDRKVAQTLALFLKELYADSFNSAKDYEFDAGVIMMFLEKQAPR